MPEMNGFLALQLFPESLGNLEIYLVTGHHSLSPSRAAGFTFHTVLKAALSALGIKIIK